MHFVEASAATLVGDGWEIFILMEYCGGGGLIDFLNTRWQQRLSEQEVLRLFRDVCEGVQVMHHQDPVLVHRDIKIENVLLTATQPPRFKLCDFGSCFPVLSTKPARSAEELRRLEMELNQHTTIQYRAPEMIDLGMQVAITEKADIWALGVFLYKLCYYTTPFEAPGAGPAAILQARYECPSKPSYSADLQHLIHTMLRVQAAERPTIDQVVKYVEDLLRTSDTASRPPKPRPTSPIPSSSTLRRSATYTAKPTATSSPAPSTTTRQSRLPPSSDTPSTGKASPRPPSAKPVPSSPPPSAARSQGRPESLILDVDEAAERFPSLQSLDKQHPIPRRSVRDMVHDMNLYETPASSSSPSVSIAMDQRGPPRPRTASEKPAHTLVAFDDSVPSSSSDDEVEAPEEAEATLRIRPRSFVPSPPPLVQSSPSSSLHDLLAQNETAPSKPEVSPSAPAQDELHSLAEHEKALRRLLGEESLDEDRRSPPLPLPTRRPRSPSRTSSARPGKPPKPGPSAKPSLRERTSPPTGDLLHMGSSNTSSAAARRAPAWDNDEEAAPSASSLRHTSSATASSTPTPTSVARATPSSSSTAAAEPAEAPAAPTTTRVQLRASTWDAATKAPAKVYVDASTSPGLPSSASSTTPRPHSSHAPLTAASSTSKARPVLASSARRTSGIASDTPVVAPVPRIAGKPASTMPPTAAAASLDAALAQQRAGQVRLTKRETQNPASSLRSPRPTALAQPGLAATRPPPCPAPMADNTEEEAPFQGVSALIRQWQGQ